MKNARVHTSQGSNHKKGMLIQEAYDQIKHLISINQLVPGQKLIYGNIAERLNIGVTPVIQALNRLEASGLVRYEANKGYFVGEISEKEVRQLYRAREALELAIIPDVIENINKKALSEIEQRFKRSHNIRLSRRELILEDTQFHLGLIRYAHNDVIYNILENIFEQVYLKYRPEYLDDERIKVIKNEHKDLLSALRSRDVDKAAALIRGHIRDGTDYVVKTIKAEKNWFSDEKINVEAT